MRTARTKLERMLDPEIYLTHVGRCRWFRALMRILFTWLAVLGVFAGMLGTASAADPCDVLLAMHGEEHADHQHEPGKPCDPVHDKQCPLEHHQHCSCSHAMPMAAELLAPVKLGVHDFSLSPIRGEAELPHDGPVMALDKPPLI